MLFNSLDFLVFFPVVTSAYFLLPHRYRWALLLAASAYFYMAFIPEYVLILAFTITVDYLTGIGLEGLEGSRRKWLLVASMAANIGVLAFFKYFNFANQNIAALAEFIGWNYPIDNLHILLPIGLSFHTFQSLSYTIEVYRRKQPAERHFGYLATYVMFFPQLVAGPIERPQNILHQLHSEHTFEYRRVSDGLKWMAWGMFKKVVIADRMALFVSPVYDGPEGYAGPALVAATLAFAVQIYCDFSGYSDIALGSAQVLGIRLMKNFNHPYLASSVADFWRRWHISLSTWFRDYLYIPLGGNRVRAPRWTANILLTFLVSGIWHGANWTFAIWGLLHGMYLLIAQAGQSAWGKILPTTRLPRFEGARRAVGTATTFCLVSFAWIFFRATDLHDAAYIAGNLFQGWNEPWRYAREVIANLPGNLAGAVDAFNLLVGTFTSESRGMVVLTAFALLVFITIELLQSRGDLLATINTKPAAVRLSLYALMVVAILALGTAYTGYQQAFIYFQF